MQDNEIGVNTEPQDDRLTEVEDQPASTFMIFLALAFVLLVLVPLGWIVWMVVR